MKLNLILLAFAASIFTACEHNGVYDPEAKKGTKDLIVPKDFDWEVSENVNFSVTSKVKTSVAVYEDEACKSLLATLPANEEATIYHLNVPKGTEKLFVQYPTADGKVGTIPAAVVKTKGKKDDADVRVQLPEDGTGKGDWFDQQEKVIYYPALSKGWGTIFFEDMWPQLGDYDFNDVAVWYKVQLYTEDNAMMVSLRLNALGGNMPYQLCLQLDDVKAKYITGVEDYPYGMGDGSGKYVQETQGESLAVFAFDWGKKKGINGGKFYNTESAYQVDSDDLDKNKVTFIIYLDENVNVTDMDWYSFNFFIRKTDGTEIHLKGYQPTEAFKTTYDQIVAEHEELDSENTYCTKNGLVWGVKVPLGISHAIENVDFKEAYKFFEKWVTTAGKEKKNWFEENAGKELRINVGKSK